MKRKVLLPQAILPEGYAYLESHGFEVVEGRSAEEKDIIADIGDCDAMIVRTARITADVIAAAPKLRIIARHGAGYDRIDLEACRRQGILVCTAGGANAISVAETAVFYMLYCSRNFRSVLAHFREDYRYAKFGIPKGELHGKTLGLIGTGNIGRLVAQKAVYGFDMKVLAYDPFARDVPEYITMAENRDDVFRQADYVSLHVPALPSTIHSVGDHEFELMKETAYLINTSRGAVVDEAALIRALQDKKIAGAGLDVLEQEPFDLDNPLLAMENVLTAPHIGGATREASVRSSVACAEAVDDFFAGRMPKFVVPELRDLVSQ